MYYYILEPPKNVKLRRFQQKIKDILGDLGIAGETVLPSPARTVEELCEIGISKGYSTIVAVGSEKHINKVVSAILVGEVVLGAIPTDESQKIYQIIGTSNIRSSCLSLKYRKIASLDVGEISPSQYFITPVEIHRENPFGLKIEFKDYGVEAQCTDLILTPKMQLYLKNSFQKELVGKKFLKWLFGQQNKDDYSSFFHGRKLRVETSEPLPLTINSEVVAKTPISAKTLPGALKIIVSRDIIK